VTKFDALKTFLARKRTFRFGDINKHFKQQKNSLNSYTTYLNTLRHAGLVKQTGRGTYTVVDAKRLRAVTLGDAQLVFKVNRLKRDLKFEKEMHGVTRKQLGQAKANENAAKVELEHANHLLKQLQLELTGTKPTPPPINPEQDAVDTFVNKMLLEDYGVHSVPADAATLKQLGLDSLDEVEFLMALEEEFEFFVDDEQAEAAMRDSLGAVKNLVRKLKCRGPKSGAV
jgi:acyl carrier protein